MQEVVLSPTASSYVMAELTRSTEYSVRLQAIAGAQRSRHADAAFTTGKDAARGAAGRVPVLHLFTAGVCFQSDSCTDGRRTARRSC